MARDLGMVAHFLKTAAAGQSLPAVDVPGPGGLLCRIIGDSNAGRPAGISQVSDEKLAALCRTLATVAAPYCVERCLQVADELPCIEQW